MPRILVAALLLLAASVLTTAQDGGAGEKLPAIGELNTVVPDRAAVQPALAADANGKLHVVYGADKDGLRQIFLRTSTDGAAWSEPELVSEGAYEVMAGNTRGPSIGISDDTVVVTAHACFKKGEDKHLYCFRKRAKDKRFTATRVSGDRGKDMEGLHHMVVDAEGTVHVTWLDSRNGGAEPWYASSNNQGKSFKGEMAVYTAPGGSICPCCAPSVAAQGKTIVVQFRNRLKNMRDGADYNDMYAAVSTDAGKKWNCNRLDDRERWKG